MALELGRVPLLAWVVAVAVGFIATAYGPPWDAMQGTGTTATGVHLAPQPTNVMTGPYVVAVDPAVIPLGSKLRINPNPFGDPSIIFTAADTGGAIKGNRIDFYDSRGRADQLGWGRRPVNVSVIGKGSQLASTVPFTGQGTGLQDSQASGSSNGSEWVKLLLDVAFLGIGGYATYRGGRRMLESRAG